MDIEKFNRVNFRSFLKAISYPGTPFKIESIYNSYILAAASTFVSPETTYYIDDTDKVKESAAIITNGLTSKPEDADYIFSDKLDIELLSKSKSGDFLNPDKSATLFFQTLVTNQIQVTLSGAGINGKKRDSLSIGKDFIESFYKKNMNFPVGVDVFLLNSNGYVVALPRSIKIEVL